MSWRLQAQLRRSLSSASPSTFTSLSTRHLPAWPLSGSETWSSEFFTAVRIDTCPPAREGAHHGKQASAAGSDGS